MKPLKMFFISFFLIVSNFKFILLIPFRANFLQFYLIFKININHFFQKCLKLNASIPVDDNGLKIKNLNGLIEFKNVSFAYPNRKLTVNE
jgi:hypothetical protein